MYLDDLLKIEKIDFIFPASPLLNSVFGNRVKEL